MSEYARKMLHILVAYVTTLRHEPYTYSLSLPADIWIKNAAKSTVYMYFY